MSIDSPTDNPNWMIILRAPSGVTIVPNRWLRLRAVEINTSDGPIPVETTISTLYPDRERTRSLQRDIQVEASVTAVFSELAIQAASLAAKNLVPTLGFCANATVGDPYLELAYEHTAGVTQRHYHQRLLQIEPAVGRPSRNLDVVVAQSVTTALATHSEGERLSRAIAHYNSALAHWQLGEETLAVEHLWIAVEALTKAFIREESRKLRITNPRQLAEKRGIELGKLDADIRLKEVFQSDSACYEKACEASTGYEHSFLALEDVHSLASQVRDCTANYVRSATIRLLSLNPTIVERLERAPYDQPLKGWQFAIDVEGRLVGQADTLASPGWQHPALIWKREVDHNSISVDEVGSISVSGKDTMVAVIANDVRLVIEKVEPKDAQVEADLKLGAGCKHCGYIFNAAEAEEPGEPPIACPNCGQTGRDWHAALGAISPT